MVLEHVKENLQSTITDVRPGQMVYMRWGVGGLMMVHEHVKKDLQIAVADVRPELGVYMRYEVEGCMMRLEARRKGPRERCCRCQAWDKQVAGLQVRGR